MESQITVKYLQNYIQLKDYKPEAVRDYFLKLSEEVGELAEAIRKGNILSDKSNNIKARLMKNFGMLSIMLLPLPIAII